MKRSWACVLSLDAVGFSRMMARDDMAAVSAIRTCRGIVEDHARRCGGRIFGTAGDSFMLAFAAEDAAVCCAIGIQTAMLKREGMPEGAAALSLRAGIDAGNVIDDDGNLYGDAVNIAARLQEVCRANGILISHRVHAGLERRSDLRSAGELSLRNITTPVPIFEVMEGDHPLGAAPGDAAVIDLTRSAPGFESAPTLAVMPLENLTGDPGHHPACRGFSEDLINALSRMRQFAVIDRNSTFSEASGRTDAAAIGRRFGARYVLDGVLELAGEALVARVRLIDLEAGRSTWSERYGLDADNLAPALEDATRRITATLGGRIEQAEGARSRARRESRVGVRGLLWRSRWHLDQLTARDAEEGLRLLREAERADPGNPEVLIHMAHWHWIDAWSMRRPPAILSGVRTLALAARDADPLDARGHLLVGVAEILLRNIDDAQHNLETAVALNPSLAMGAAQIGSCHNLKGEYEKAVPQLELSLRLSPQDYYVFYVYGELAISHCMMGDWAKAVAYARKALALRPSYWNARMSEIAALVHAGDMEEAALSFQTLMFRKPNFSLRYIEWLPYQASGVHAFFADAIQRAQTFSASDT